MLDASTSLPTAFGVYGTAGADLAKQIVATTDGFVVAGQLQSSVTIGGRVLATAGSIDIFMLGLDAAGGVRWARTIISGGGSETPIGMAVDDADNFYVVGNMDGSIDCGGGPLPVVGLQAAYVCSFDVNGQHRWSRSFGGPVASPGGSNDAASGVTIANDVVTVAGNVHGPVDFGGGMTAASGTGFDGYVAAYRASDGGFLRVRRFGLTGVTDPQRVVADRSGGTYVVGWFGGSVDLGRGAITSRGEDVFVIAYDAAGEPRWSTTIDSTTDEAPRGLAIDDAGIYVLGYFDGPSSLALGTLSLTSPGHRDGFAAALTHDGAPRWLAGIGGSGCGRFEDAVTARCGELVVAGAFAGSLQFAGTQLVSAGGSDGLVAGFDTDGTPRWIRSHGGIGEDGAVGVALIDGTSVLSVGFRDAAGSICGGLTAFSERDLAIDITTVPP